jgi:hypothetical protein
MENKCCLFFTLLVCSLLLSSCTSYPSTELLQTKANSKDGAYMAANGFSLVIPPDVLPKDSKITVNLLRQPPSTGMPNLVQLGRVYEVKAGSQTLNGQAYITLPYNDIIWLPDGIRENKLTIAYFTEDDSRWVALPSRVDVTAKTVSTMVDHFSLFSIVSWITKDGPPEILDFRFSPSNYTVDCSQISNPNWFTEHPIVLSLQVTDPEGTEDIRAMPEVTVHTDYSLASDWDSKPIFMNQTSPGHYQISWNLLPNSVNASLLLDSITGQCGNLNSYIAHVKVRDQSGNKTEGSTVQKIYYEPVPEIVLLSPSLLQPAPSLPEFSWDVRAHPDAFEHFSELRLLISTDPAFNNGLVINSIIHNISLPPDQRSYRLQSPNLLQTGKTYYWKITAYRPQTAGFSSLSVSSQASSFFVSEPAEQCILSGKTGCISVQVFQEGKFGKDAWVYLYDKSNNQYAGMGTVDERGYAIFPGRDESDYTVDASAYGYKLWDGSACPIHVKANLTSRVEINLEPGDGTVYCSQTIPETPGTDENTAKSSPTPLPFISQTPLPTPTAAPTQPPKPTDTPLPEPTFTPPSTPTIAPPPAPLAIELHYGQEVEYIQNNTLSRRYTCNTTLIASPNTDPSATLFNVRQECSDPEFPAKEILVTVDLNQGVEISTTSQNPNRIPFFMGIRADGNETIQILNRSIRVYSFEKNYVERQDSSNGYWELEMVNTAKYDAATGLLVSYSENGKYYLTGTDQGQEVIHKYFGNRLLRTYLLNYASNYSP